MRHISWTLCCYSWAARVLPCLSNQPLLGGPFVSPRDVLPRDFWWSVEESVCSFLRCSAFVEDIYPHSQELRDWSRIRIQISLDLLHSFLSWFPRGGNGILNGPPFSPILPSQLFIITFLWPPQYKTRHVCVLWHMLLEMYHLVVVGGMVGWSEAPSIMCGRGS